MCNCRKVRNEFAVLGGDEAPEIVFLTLEEARNYQAAHGGNIIPRRVSAV